MTMIGNDDDDDNDDDVYDDNVVVVDIVYGSYIDVSILFNLKR